MKKKVLCVSLCIEKASLISASKGEEKRRNPFKSTFGFFESREKN